MKKVSLIVLLALGLTVTNAQKPYSKAGNK